MKDSLSIEVDTSQLVEGFAAFATRLDAALEMYGNTVARDWETKAKHNRPWTDRTNRAREGLTGSSELTSTELRMVLAHTVDYGIWLELAHEKNWAIVEPTVRLNQENALQGLSHLIDNVHL